MWLICATMGASIESNGIQRIPGANEGASEPANWRVDFNDGKWVGLVKAINELRGEGMFTRTTDILGSRN